LQGVEVAMGLQQVEPADIVEAINEIVGLKLKVSPNAMDLGAQQQQQQDQADQAHELGMAQANNQTAGATHTIGANGQITPIKPINPSPAGPGADSGKGPSGPSPTGGTPGALAKPKPPAMLGAPAPGKSPGKIVKPGMGMSKAEDEPMTAVGLAHGMLKALRKRDFVELNKSLSVFNSLDGHAQDRVAQATNELFFLDPSLDPQGLAELSSCAMAVMSGHPHQH